MNEITPFSRCCVRVNDGASMVRGLQRKRDCEGKVVFVSGGKFYCAAHGKHYGYVAPAKAPRYTYVVHYTTPEGKRSWCWVYDAKNMRGARMAFLRRHPGATLEELFEKTDAMIINSEGRPTT